MTWRMVLWKGGAKIDGEYEMYAAWNGAIVTAYTLRNEIGLADTCVYSVRLFRGGFQ